MHYLNIIAKTLLYLHSIGFMVSMVFMPMLTIIFIYNFTKRDRSDTSERVFDISFLILLLVSMGAVTADVKSSYIQFLCLLLIICMLCSSAIVYLRKPNTTLDFVRKQNIAIAITSYFMLFGFSTLPSAI